MQLVPFYVNQAGLSLVGLDSMAEACALKVGDFFFPEDREYVTEVFFPRVIRDGQAETEIRFRHFKTGEAIWMIYNVFFIRGADGNPIGIGTFSQNITDRKRTELALREKDERLRAALNASNTGTFRWDLRTNSLDWDNNLDRLFGLPEGQTVRSLENFVAIVHPDDRQGVVDACRRSSERGADFNMDFRVIWPDGTIHWLTDKGKAFFDETGPAYMTGACMDITAQKASEEAMRASEEKYRRLFNTMDEGFCVIELLFDAAGRAVDYRYLDVNDAFVRHVGRTVPVGTTGSEFDPGHDHPWVERYERVLRSGEPDRFQIFHPLTRRYFDLSVSRMDESANGRLAIVFNDATARRNAEEALRRSDQLAAAGRMAHSIAHEINNPLSSIVNLLYLLQHQPLPPQAIEFLLLAQSELDRVVRVTKQTLSFYQSPSQRMNIDVNRLAASTIESLKRTQVAANVDIRLRNSERTFISGHETELRHLLLNLVMNAIESGAKRVVVSLSSATHDDGIRLRVVDDGMGIPRNRYAMIFEPFFTTKPERGTGLGLWVSRSIVEKHGGTMRLRSTTTAGRSGSCFSIFLPTVPASEEQRLEPVPGAASVRHSSNAAS